MSDVSILSEEVIRLELIPVNLFTISIDRLFVRAFTVLAKLNLSAVQ